MQGMPLSLNGVMRIMGGMGWGPAGDRITTGNIGAGEVEGADAFVIIAPQNIVGHSILPFLQGARAAAGQCATVRCTAGHPLTRAPSHHRCPTATSTCRDD